MIPNPVSDGIAANKERVIRMDIVAMDAHRQQTLGLTLIAIAILLFVLLRHFWGRS